MYSNEITKGLTGLNIGNKKKESINFVSKKTLDDYNNNLRSNTIGEGNKKSNYPVKTDKNFLDLNKKVINTKTSDN
jgi:hypothetical protein